MEDIKEISLLTKDEIQNKKAVSVVSGGLFLACMFIGVTGNILFFLLGLVNFYIAIDYYLAVRQDADIKQLKKIFEGDDYES